MNGEIIDDYCEKCRCFVGKKLNSDENTLTCLICSSQEDFMLDESKLELEIIDSA